MFNHQNKKTESNTSIHTLYMYTCKCTWTCTCTWIYNSAQASKEEQAYHLLREWRERKKGTVYALRTILTQAGIRLNDPTPKVAAHSPTPSSSQSSSMFYKCSFYSVHACTCIQMYMYVSNLLRVYMNLFTIHVHVGKIPQNLVCTCTCTCIQVNLKMCSLERGYRNCVKSRRDKIGITRHV